MVRAATARTCVVLSELLTEAGFKRDGNRFVDNAGKPLNWKC